jgi:hypothetical protein
VGAGIGGPATQDGPSNKFRSVTSDGDEDDSDPGLMAPQGNGRGHLGGVSSRRPSRRGESLPSCTRSYTRPFDVARYVAAPLASSHGLALAGAPKCEGRRGDILIVGIAHVPAYDPTGGYSLIVILLLIAIIRPSKARFDELYQLCPEPADEPVPVSTKALPSSTARPGVLAAVERSRTSLRF